ncbi:MAG: ATP-dependent Clp protease adaptor ClpS [Bacteroidetes bacterium]|nr:ATP-dependent Clp protease adaptor ClpS [Bacteroidota bacterium]
MGAPLETPDIETEVTDGTATDMPSKVILFNDNVHTFEDVIGQLQKAISCSRDKGEALAWEVHTRGRACVYTGEMNECLRVSGILEEIALHTQIEM